MTAKLDLYKVNKAEYLAPTQPVVVKTKPAKYLAIQGQGAPGGDRFTACIGALYGVAFTIKMTRKFAGKQDYAICKLEAQWHFDGDSARIPQDEWKWKLLIRTPEFVALKELAQAVVTLLKRKKSPEAQEVMLETIDEGLCAQMLHVGPYEQEKESVALMHAFAQCNSLKLVGPHHEIYLSDPRRVPSDRLKTILREPAVKQV